MKRLRSESTGKYLMKSCLLAVAYFGTAKWTLTQVFQVSGDTVVPVWPASGLAVGFLAAFGYRYLPGVIAGSLLLSWPDGPSSLLGQVGTATEALLGAYLLRSLLHGGEWLTRTRDLLGLSISAVASAAVGALFGVSGLLLVGAIEWSGFGTQWFDYWLGDSLGIIMVTPLVLTLSARKGDLPRLREFQDVVVIAATLTVFSLVVFYLLPQHTAVPLLGGFFPLLLWMVFRGGPLGASTGMLIISGLSLGGTAHGHGPFATDTLTHSLYAQWVFIGVLMCTAFLFAAVLEERREAETALVEKEASLRAFYDSAPFLMGILELRQDNPVFVSCNRAATTSVDRPAQMVNVPLSEFQEAGFDVAAWADHCRESARTGEARRFEITRRTSQGTRVLSTVVAAIRSGPSEQARFSFVMEDVTERTEIERERKRLFRNALDMLCIVDFDGRVRRANPAYCKALGFSEREVRGSEFVAFFHPDDLGAADEVLKTLQAGSSVGSFETRLRKKTGELLWTLWACTPDPGGGVIYCTGKDVTAKKEAEDALRAAKDAADASVKTKSQFVANVTHELRTPLSGIIGMTNLLKSTRLNRQQVEYTDALTHSADSLMALVNDLLDFSKMEARRLRLELEPLSLRHCLGLVMRTIAPQAHQKGLELAYRVDPRVPDAVIGDPGRLRQVLINLTANAIKFTEKGEVVVRVSVDEPVSDREPRLIVHFRVSDTGIGISQAGQASIFEAFVQADGSTTRKYGGTGLGLSISRQIVELIGGRLWVVSEPGRGSTFHFTLLLWPQEVAASGFEEPVVPTLESLKVLVLDDSATVREILAAQLRDWRMEPTMVADTRQAWAAAVAAKEGGKPFDLLLLEDDPAWDVDALVARIRNELEATIPCLLTSPVSFRTPNPARNHLVGTGCLSKPVQPSHLKKAFELVLDGQPLDSEELVTTGEFFRVPGTRSLRVLLAEDDAVNRAVALHMLENAGHNVRAVEDGRQAVQAYQEEHFDVVLMDIQMPELDGLQAARRIRSLEGEGKRRTPIVALTAHVLDDNKKECRQAGIDEFVSKPLDADVLYKLLDGLDCAIDTKTQASSAAKEPTDGRAWLLVLDRQSLLRRTEGDHALAAELARIFLEECPATMENLTESVVALDTERIERLVHRLSGSLEAIAARPAAMAARKLREAALEGSSELRSSLEALRNELDKLMVELAALAKEKAIQ